MKWIDRLTECVDYIEENLNGQIEMDILCDKACLTRLYFNRLFDAVTGIPVHEYIRRRKMTLAAKELLSGQKKVIEAALDYGYSSPEAFSRAFKSVHGIPPSQVKQQGSAIKSFHRLTFSISIKGDQEMNYRIEEKKAFALLGEAITTTAVEGQNKKKIPVFWQKVNSQGICDQMCAMASEPGKMFGVCFDENSDKTFRYGIGVPYANGEKGQFEVMNIPEAKWAIFESRGPLPQAIQNVWGRIFAEWLPATGYEIANLPQIEYYPLNESPSQDDYCEVWIPLADEK